MTSLRALFALFLVTATSLPAIDWQSQPSPLAWNSTDKCPRSRALELARAFTNEGYKVRDGFWSGLLEKDRPILIEVYLFSGNDYWFSAANMDPAVRLSVSIFDSNGHPVGSESFQEESRAAGSISVIQTGRYFIQLAMTEGDTSETCMVYSYK
jgi:hypothetical protein